MSVTSPLSVLTTLNAYNSCKTKQKNKKNSPLFTVANKKTNANLSKAGIDT